MTIRTASIVLVILGLSIATIAQSGPSTGDDSSTNLKLTVTGEVFISGRHGAFRGYEAPDATRAIVSYANFPTLRAADHQTTQWSTLIRKATHSEQKDRTTGEIVGERIVGTRQNRESGTKEFVIIRRVGLTCYFISSVSLPVAIQVEDLIHNP